MGRGRGRGRGRRGIKPFPPLVSLQKSDDLLLSQFSKPKQKRHRCRNPNKIDINTLTGEERVPVVNRRNGRKVSSGLAAAASQQGDVALMTSPLPSDGRGHGSTNERASQMVTGQPGVFGCS